VLQEKYQRAQQRILDLEREKNALLVQVQAKDREVKQTLEQQKSIHKSQAGNNIKLEQKASKMQCDLKKKEAEVVKLQDQIKRLMGMDKHYY
jgi:chromosome segregation ATPase